jgi:multimeric flavodoxin WrbA
MNKISQNLSAKGYDDLAQKVNDVFRKFAEKQKIRIMVFSGSARDSENCPDQDGKTLRLAKESTKGLPDNVEVDFCDMAVKNDKSIVQPCKGCVSTAGGFHCHWYCDCYSKSDKDRPDFMHDENIYERLEKCDGFAVFSPINWYSVSSQIKAMFDRLVCANLSLTTEVANTKLKIFKDKEKSRAAAKSGKYDNLLKNHLEGKHAAFFIHGDGGADDYKRSPHPESYEKECHRGEGAYNDPRLAIMPLILQCKYSGIFVPDDLVIGMHINNGKSYAEANDDYDEDKKFFKAGKDLVEKLAKHIIENKLKE